MNAKGSTEMRNRTTMDLRGNREIVISRRFDAPARIVFDAWTRAEFVKRWWAPASRGVSMASVEAEVRVGGRYRYVMALANHEQIAFSGEYLEVTPHSRLAYTQVFEPMAQAGSVRVTVTFSERDGKTDVVATEVYPSAEVRAGVLASGMESGMRETMDQLEALVVQLSTGTKVVGAKSEM